jgi:hypothetical protein
METAARATHECATRCRMHRGFARAAAFALRAGIVAAFILAFASPAPCHAQSPVGPNGTIGGAGSQNGVGSGHSGLGRPSFSNDDDDIDPMMTERRLKALNIERQKQMVADANKLLKLARELNQEVAAANSGSFTPDQLHKIGEMEKLARNVRERMTAAVGETSNLLSSPTVIYPGR